VIRVCESPSREKKGISTLKKQEMNINDLSISDLKASYDFVLLYLKEMEDEADRIELKIETLPTYNESKELENKLYTVLLNRVKGLN
jgi:hypothetical protein